MPGYSYLLPLPVLAVSSSDLTVTRQQHQEYQECPLTTPSPGLKDEECCKPDGPQPSNYHFRVDCPAQTDQ